MRILQIMFTNTEEMLMNFLFTLAGHDIGLYGAIFNYRVTLNQNVGTASMFWELDRLDISALSV